jgi:hypothetical protein
MTIVNVYYRFFFSMLDLLCNRYFIINYFIINFIFYSNEIL